MAQMTDKIGISKRKILDNLNKLKTKNIIKRVGSAKTGYWQIIHGAK
jgi:ATP-dependent DNA helicase RecG